MSPTISIKSDSISEPIQKFSTIPDQDPISKPRQNTIINHNLSTVSSSIASSITSTKKTKVKNYSGYLKFENPTYYNQVFDSFQSPTQVGLTANLCGQFCLSTITDVDPSDDCSNNYNCMCSSSSAQDLLIDDELELTFYRRNLFQVSSIASNISSAVYSVSPSTGNKSPIVTMAMEISITSTDNINVPKLLYIPTKSESTKDKSKNANVELEPKVHILRDQTNGDIQPSIVFWDRLQFRNATTHNGRRQLQNFYTLGITLFAELATRERVPLMKIVTKPIVVRGRNPLFYEGRRTIYITDLTVRTNEFALRRETVERKKRRLSEILDHSIAVKPEENVELKAPKPVKRTRTCKCRLETPSIVMKSEENVEFKALKRVARAKTCKSRPKTISIKTENNIDLEESINKSEKKNATKEEDESKHSNVNTCQYEYIEMPESYMTASVDYFYRPHSMNYL